mmetsp:Transcript_10426/g.34519  ORF Transcript_10426/g.34519 Transcript_10426/m.34519 type:complete len:232 (+) Transcript_10426:1216-1911(+)
MMSSETEQSRSSMSTTPNAARARSGSDFHFGQSSTLVGSWRASQDFCVSSSASVISRRFSTSSSAHWSKSTIVFWSQPLWNPGEMTRRRRFQTSGSAGMRPLPMMGSRISERMPLSKFSAETLRMCRAIAGSATTMKLRGPKASLYTGPSSPWYLFSRRKSGPPTSVCKSPVTTLYKSLPMPCSEMAPCQSHAATLAPSSESLPRNWRRLLKRMRMASMAPGLLPGYVDPA